MKLPVKVPVYVVLPPRTLLLDAAGPLEVLRRANWTQDAIRFDVRYVAPTRRVTTSIGLTVGDLAPLPRVLPKAAMVVIAGEVDQMMAPPHRGASRADLRDEAAIVRWLGAVIQPSHTLVCICSGSLLAARAGLLDGYACTTHHSCCADLAALAPRATVLENRLYVEDRQRLTSAGVTAGIDLMLAIVSRMTDYRCALTIARYLVVYLRRSGTDPQLSPWLEGRNHLHPVVHRVQDAMAADPARAWTMRMLTQVAGASSRHLSRLFHEHASMSIVDYRTRLRVALARELIGQTQLDMERVAERAGFASPRQLRRAWRKFHATAPREARSQIFASRQ